jgi:hypothetical protein
MIVIMLVAVRILNMGMIRAVRVERTGVPRYGWVRMAFGTASVPVWIEWSCGTETLEKSGGRGDSWREVRRRMMPMHRQRAKEVVAVVKRI